MSNFLKNIARNFVFPVVCRLGLEKLYSRAYQNKTVILNYHGVISEPTPGFSIRHLQKEQFEDQLKYLKRNFQILPLSEVCRMHQEGKSTSRRTIALTFDDGYENNLLIALPLLEKHQVPATFYACTAAFENPDHIIWGEVVDFLHGEIKAQNLEIKGQRFQPSSGGYFSSGSQISLYQFVKTISKDERDELLKDLDEKYNVLAQIKALHPTYWRQVTPEQLKQLAASDYAEIGSHTHFHYNLEQLNPSEAKHELTHSKSFLENILGREINTIAFPDGSYNQAVKELCYKIGYKNLMALAYKCESDPKDLHLFPRMDISNTTTWQSNAIRIHKLFSQVGF